MPEARSLVCALVVGLLAGCGGKPAPTEKPVRSRYQAGQVWSYTTRKTEERSRVHVVRVETHPKFGVMVHVYVDGLKIPNPRATGPKDELIRVISHMPMSVKAMDASVTDLLLENQPIPPYEAGYTAWKKAFLAGEATIFEQPLAEKLRHYAAGIAASASTSGKDAQRGS